MGLPSKRPKVKSYRFGVAIPTEPYTVLPPATKREITTSFTFLKMASGGK